MENLDARYIVWDENRDFFTCMIEFVKNERERFERRTKDLKEWRNDDNRIQAEAHYKRAAEWAARDFDIDYFVLAFNYTLSLAELIHVEASTADNPKKRRRVFKKWIKIFKQSRRYAKYHSEDAPRKAVCDPQSGAVIQRAESPKFIVDWFLDRLKKKTKNPAT